MKSLLIAVYGVCLATSLTAIRADDSKEVKEPATAAHTAPEHKRPALTEEQKTARKELMAKYDTNKDGKLDKDERAKISTDDKAKLKKAGLQARQKKAVKKD